MSKNLMLLSLLLVSSSLLADDALFINESPPRMPAIAFPYSAEQAWYTQGALLVWKPYMEDFDYANRMKMTETLPPTNEFPFASALFSLKPKKPDFEWSTGVRVGLGRYLPHDLWDVALTATYFYGDADNHSSPDRNQSDLLFSTWDPTMGAVGGTTKGTMSWKLNFFTLDLSFGREYLLLSNLNAHPFIGLRGVGVYQDYKSRLSDDFTTSSLTRFVKLEKFSAEDRFLGVGPRAGADFSFYMGKHCALVGSFAGAFFWGQYHAREKTLSRTIQNDIFGNNNLFKAKDHDYDVRTQIEGALGLAWETWTHDNTVRIAPSLNFEASTWFAMNDLFTLISRGSPTGLPFNNFDTMRRNGDLSFVGVNINLHIDF